MRLPEDLKKAAEKYAKTHKYKNLQELATDAVREKITGKEYDESLTVKEIELIDRLIDTTIKKGALVSENELRKALK